MVKPDEPKKKGDAKNPVSVPYEIRTYEQDNTFFFRPQKKFGQEWWVPGDEAVYNMIKEWILPRIKEAGLTKEQTGANMDTLNADRFVEMLVYYCYHDADLITPKIHTMPKIEITNTDGSIGTLPDPESFAKLRASAEQTLSSLNAIEKVAGKERFIDFCMGISKYMGKYDFDFFRIIKARPEWKEKCNFVFALMQCQGVEQQPSIELKIQEIGKRIDILERLGVEHPNRPTPNQLESSYLALTEGKVSDRLCIIIFPESDWNGTFYGRENTDGFIENGYTVIYCEAKTDDEFRQRWFNHGLLDNDKKMHKKLEKKKYDSFLWGAHGHQTYITFSDGKNEKHQFGVSDKPKMKKYDFGSMLEEKATGVIDACSTAKPMGSSTTFRFIPGTFAFYPVFEKRENFLTFSGDLLSKAVIYASPIDAATSKLKFDRDRRLCGIEFLGPDMQPIGSYKYTPRIQNPR